MEPQGEKYIRTYAGDIETVQKGGQPDLAPLPATPASAPVVPLTSTPTPPPATPGAPVAPPPAPAPTPLPRPAPEHTYAGDVAVRMSTTQASRASILAAEQDASRPAPRPVAPPARSNRWYVMGGIALVLLGALGAYVAYAHYIAGMAPVSLVPTVSAPIPVDEREQVSGTGSALMLALEQSVGRPLATGAARLVYDSTATSSDASIFNELELPAPGSVLRNITASGSMAGVITATAGTQTPFFILSVSSYSDTFAGMLAWEPAMLQSLGGLFPPYPVPQMTMATSTVATSTPAITAATTTTPAIPAGFTDEVVANHDARVDRDSSGRSLLIYGYWDQQTLVIARDEAAFTAILGRLASSRSK